MKAPSASRPDDDRALMLRAAQGDEEAFSRLVRSHQKSLLNYFLRMGAYYEEAEDLVQETFVRLYRHRRRYRPIAGFRTFLFTLARNARVDRLRKAGREPAQGADPLPEEAPSSERGRSVSEARLDVREAVDRLSGKLKETVVLTVYQGLSYPEAAEILGVPLGTVKSRMFAAMRRLRQTLEVEDDEAPPA